MITSVEAVKTAQKGHHNQLAIRENGKKKF